MDIVVTIPKSEYKNDNEENKDITKNGYDAFWTFKRAFPKKLNKGNRIYFVKHNVIYNSMVVREFCSEYKQICATTNRVWQGHIVILDELRDEQNLNINVKGFQGFRYKWW